ncbi:MAG: hypothetical protein IPM24_14560 [Bryobacterales bacterium]|nr:hypothetical protein [Bryobacterales bacterium]
MVDFQEASPDSDDGLSVIGVKLVNENCEQQVSDVTLQFSALARDPANVIWPDGDNSLLASVPPKGKESMYFYKKVKTSGSGLQKVRARITECDGGECTPKNVRLAPEVLESDPLDSRVTCTMGLDSILIRGPAVAGARTVEFRIFNTNCDGSVTVALAIVGVVGSVSAMSWPDTNVVRLQLPARGTTSPRIPKEFRYSGEGGFKIRAQIESCNGGDCESNGFILDPGHLVSRTYDTE